MVCFMMDWWNSLPNSDKIAVAGIVVSIVVAIILTLIVGLFFQPFANDIRDFILNLKAKILNTWSPKARLTCSIIALILLFLVSAIFVIQNVIFPHTVSTDATLSSTEIQGTISANVTQTISSLQTTQSNATIQARVTATIAALNRDKEKIIRRLPQ